MMADVMTAGPIAINDPATLAEVKHAFIDYEIALQANDVEALRKLFWDNELTLRYGSDENLYGAEAIAAFRAARPKGPRPRTLAHTKITTFGRDFATANTEFHSPGRHAVGRQSQSWVRLPEGWKIVAAHVSYLENAPG